MNETDFQALFNAYRTAALAQKENPVPPALHLMVYNYARIRHQQSSDVSGDFYLHVSNKLEGILHRYDASLLPFYQYMAQTLNFEFGHFLRRRKLPRSQIRLQSIEELREKRVELFENTDAASLTKEDILDAVIQSVPLKNQKYAKIALALPLTYADLRAIIHKQQNNKNTAINTTSLKKSIYSGKMLKPFVQFLQIFGQKYLRSKTIFLFIFRNI